MNKPEHHILVCSSFRLTGEVKGACIKKGDGLLQYLEEEILDRGIDALVCSTGCLKECKEGPVMVIHPMNAWYGNVDKAAIDDILDALEDGEVAEKYVM